MSLGVMSKAFGLGGLRVGWIVCRDAAVRRELARIKDYTTICSAAPSEVLALAALRARHPILQRITAILRTNIRALRSFFERNRDWCDWVPPRAGSVCFPRLLREDSDIFAPALVDAEDVLILPASQFGHFGGSGHFRLGFGRADMPQALDRFEAFGAARFRR
jgi:aspartate/methionine/tyrosine aminotransferase